MSRLVCAVVLATATATTGCWIFSGSSAEDPSDYSLDDWNEEADDDGTTERKKKRRRRNRARRKRPMGVPRECVTQGEFCVPPLPFVKRLCRHRSPDVAIYMMGSDQPWTRRFVRVKQAPAVNPFTGRTNDEKLTFGEEVLVLRYRTNTDHNQMQVSGQEGYDLLRWDGSCASLAEGELVKWMPKKQVTYPLFAWRRLGSRYREALRTDRRVTQAEEVHEELCHGATLARSPQCVKATEALSKAIARAVRAGLDLPKPKRIR